MSIGLLNAFRRHGLNVGYSKPLGQRPQSIDGHTLHEDALVVSRSLGVAHDKQAAMAVPLPRGRVGKEIKDLRSEELLDEVRQKYAEAAKGHDLVVVEGMGHVGMGSCLRMSAAEVSSAIGARVLLISGGGIGSAIDNISLSWEFLRARGADPIGVILNKVWPEKYTHVKEAATVGLGNLGIRTFGAVPYEEELANPTIAQVRDLLDGELLSGQERQDELVKNTIIAAMAPDTMIRYLKPSTLVITPGDNRANIMASLKAHLVGGPERSLVAGLILTGGLEPDSESVETLRELQIPAILVKADTYTAASKFHETTFKITPDDKQKIEWTICLAAQYVDVEAILQELDV
jgi:BioD-like phosphotransacetylase family protein